MTLSVLIAATVLGFSEGGVDFKVDAESVKIDPAKSVFLTVTLTKKASAPVALPDLRERVVGFSLAEDFESEPTTGADGLVTQVANWRLVPEPVARVYKIKPFVVGSNIVGPLYFEPPAARESVTGDMEVRVSKDLPPFSWKLLGLCFGALAAVVALVWGIVLFVRFLMRKLKEHRMSPIERAWVELERLIRKGLPGRGRYKDFYVELTMVVRRYVQRKYGIRAPQLTTEEFLRDKRIADLSQSRLAELRAFLESADLVKFAGVEATPEMADAATEGARNYLKGDDSDPTLKEPAK